MLALIDVVSPNALELRAMAHALQSTTTTTTATTTTTTTTIDDDRQSVERDALTVTRAGCACVVATLGAGGCLVRCSLSFL